MNDIYTHAVAVIREKVKMHDVLGIYGIEVDRNGFAVCPFHCEKTPSFSTYKNDTRFKCFGCGIEGDVISFIEKRENVSFREAVRRSDELFNLYLFNKPTLRQYRKQKSAVNEIRRKREEQKKYAEQLENEYWVQLRVYKIFYDAVERNKPQSPESAPTARFLNALECRTAAEHKLDEIFLEICNRGGETY